MLTLRSIYAARAAVDRLAFRTPLVPAPSLCGVDREVRLKLETTQPVGAFKLRGAANALVNLGADKLARGVVCVSTGNHGRALAYAANQLGAKATICISSLVPDNKIEAIAALGADVRIHGKNQDEAQRLVDRLVAEAGMTEIPPFDHPDVIAGQGTIGLEILEDWPEVDTVIAGLSGGGLIAGIGLALKSIDRDIRVIGVSPVRGAAMVASLAAGKPVEVDELPTLADSLGGGIGLDNRYTFDLVRRFADRVVQLDERSIANAMRHLFLEEGLVTEGAAAVGAGVLLEPQSATGMQLQPGKRVAIVVSGRNVDMQQFREIIDGTHHAYRDSTEQADA